MSPPLQHHWQTVSRHRTSDGVVAYQRCRCGAWRVRLDARTALDFRTTEAISTLAEPGHTKGRAGSPSRPARTRSAER
ncbi:hypothetical protein [Pseudonocardia phyllosphaerae]|uniref:hypothetical protein n=1 Tax=Pseudonocardia phyllosphaerae TaxID=3390502 RepID=UPI00397E59C3